MSRDGWRVYGPYEESVRGVPRWRVVVARPGPDAGDAGAGPGRDVRPPALRRETRTFADRATAEAWADGARARVRGDLTVAAALDEYRRHLETKGNRPNSVGLTIHRLGKWLPGERTLAGLAPRFLVEAYTRRQGEVAADTHRNELAEVKTFFRWCVDARLLPRNPAEGIAPVGRRKKGKPQLRRAEAVAFDHAALVLARKGDAGALAALAVLWLGLRSAELRHLRVRDVDVLPGGTWLWIERLEELKSRAARRRLEVPLVLAKLLARQAANRGSEEYLFPAPRSESGHHVGGWLAKAVKRVCAAAKIPYAPPHGLRGTHSTLAEEAGTSAHVVASQLGHESHRTTEEHYLAEGAGEQGRARRFLKVLEGGKRRRSGSR
jgi:integrase